VRAHLQEFVQALSRERISIWLCDTHTVKALRAGESGERGLDCRRI
jgi:hypothetical protein